MKAVEWLLSLAGILAVLVVCATLVNVGVWLAMQVETYPRVQALLAVSGGFAGLALGIWLCGLVRR